MTNRSGRERADWFYGKHRKWRFTVERDDARDHLEIWAQSDADSSIPAILEQKFFTFKMAIEIAKKLARHSQ